MKNLSNCIKFIIIYLTFFSSENVFAQLGFCQGNSGDPIFTETFGTGTTDSPLPAGTTTYNYANGGEPNDGLYTVSSNTNYFDWFSVQDHTPDDTNGRMLVVNSASASGEFYRTTINGLCENTSYEFSSWILNLTPANGFCGAGAIPVNVRFEIWDNTDTNLLASGNTGNINSTNTPIWDQYALVFQTIVGQTSVILKMINNGSGGCGNDLAIDDIVFKSCGDFIMVTNDTNDSSIILCSSQTPYSTVLTANPDNTVFSNHFYQWQESTDEINWTDIPGETADNLTITANSTMYYRAKVAEFESNLNNLDCLTFSNTFNLIINQAPNPPTIECWETATFNDASCSWEVTGIQPTEPTGLECWETTNFNTASCSWEITGTQPIEPTGLECWETATFNDTSCSWEITGNQSEEPTGLECWETINFNTTTCSWDITGTQPTQPTNLECWEATTFSNTSCSWEITGTQPAQPIGLECWETTNFNSATCSWDITGTQPTEPTGLECWETTTFNNTSCSWEVTGTQPAQPTGLECWETTNFNSTTCSWEITGTQSIEPTGLECWETATFNDTSCSWEVSGEQPEEPLNLECYQTATFNNESCSWEISGEQIIETIEEFRTICEDEDVVLQADTTIFDASYLWDSGETTAFITVNSPGTYSVLSSDGCAIVEKTIIVEQSVIPMLGTIQSDGSNIIVFTSNTGNFLYSLDGVNYQTSNIFFNINGGNYSVYIKSADCDFVLISSHLHFYIPKFITPNDDGVNDTFSLGNLEFYNSSEVYIFDRFGKLLFSAKNSSVNWTGRYNDKPLPTSDYWYLIMIEGQEFRGHFTLKR